MKYAGMPAGMWILFRKSFKRNLVSALDFDRKTASEITGKARQDYRRIIERLPGIIIA